MFVVVVEVGGERGRGMMVMGKLTLSLFIM